MGVLGRFWRAVGHGINLGRSVRPPVVQYQRVLPFHEGVEIPHFFQTPAAGGGGSVEKEEAFFGKAAELGKLLGFLFEHAGPEVGHDAVKVAAVAGQAEALDDAHADEHARAGADGGFAGLQGVGELVHGLVGRVADEEPAQDSAGHAGQAGLFPEETETLYIFVQVIFWQRNCSGQRFVVGGAHVSRASFCCWRPMTELRRKRRAATRTTITTTSMKMSAKPAPFWVTSSRGFMR